MSLFEVLEEEFQSLTSQIQRKLGSSDGCTSNLEVKDQLRRCDQILQQLKIEAREDEDDKEELMSRLKLYKIQLKSLKDHIRETQFSELSQREELFGSSLALERHNMNQENTVRSNTFSRDSTSGTAPTQVTTRDLSGRIRLNQQNKTLERARRSIAEVEDVAGAISTELSRNRETMESSHKKIAEVSTLTNDANQILTRMKKRWFC